MDNFYARTFTDTEDNGYKNFMQDTSMFIITKSELNNYPMLHVKLSVNNSKHCFFRSTYTLHLFGTSASAGKHKIIYNFPYTKKVEQTRSLKLLTVFCQGYLEISQTLDFVYFYEYNKKFL